VVDYKRYYWDENPKAAIRNTLTILDFLDNLFVFPGFKCGVVSNEGFLGWNWGAAGIDGGEKDQEGGKLDLHDDVDDDGVVSMGLCQNKTSVFKDDLM
jgi:hypothetical protein